MTQLLAHPLAQSFPTRFLTRWTEVAELARLVILATLGVEEGAGLTPPSLVVGASNGWLTNGQCSDASIIFLWLPALRQSLFGESNLINRDYWTFELVIQVCACLVNKIRPALVWSDG